MSEEFKLEFIQTPSGHLRADFTDDYGESCILKGSEVQQKVWLKSPSSDRPCFNREMAKAIGFALIRFAKTGSLAEPTPEQSLAHFKAVIDEQEEYDLLSGEVAKCAREFTAHKAALYGLRCTPAKAEGEYCHWLQGKIHEAETALDKSVDALEAWMKEHGWEVKDR